jgi:hypothetical protein
MEIAEAIERECRKDLDTLVKRTEIPREGWLSMAILAADKTGEVPWEQHKEWLRDRAKLGRKFAKDIEDSCIAAGARGFAELSETLKPQMESLRQRSDDIGKFLKKNGRRDHNHTLIVLLDSILGTGTKMSEFNCWEALARVIAQAYRVADREKEAKKITADMLSMTSRRNRTLKTGEQAT